MEIRVKLSFISIVSIFSGFTYDFIIHTYFSNIDNNDDVTNSVTL